MRPLSPDEYNHLAGMSKGKFTLIYFKITELLPGTGLVIEKSDWKTKGAPYRIVKNVAKNTGRKFEKGRMPDGNGWYVKRIT